jgi:hypothetical protein
MVIRDVKRILSQRQEATLSELVFELRCERSMVRVAIDFWADRGRIELVRAEAKSHAEAKTHALEEVPAPDSAACSSGCGGCGLVQICTSPAMRYRWIDP